SPVHQPYSSSTRVDLSAAYRIGLGSGRQEARDTGIAFPIWSARPQVARRGRRRQDNIAVVDAEQLVDPMRADVAKHHGQIPGHLALYVEIPLHHVIAF